MNARLARATALVDGHPSRFGAPAVGLWKPRRGQPASMSIIPRQTPLDVLARAAHARLVGDASTSVTDVVLSTQEVGPGALFCCLPGSKADGHDFAAEAVQRGAVALLVERPLDLPVPQLLVQHARAAVGPIAATFWGHPSQDLRLVGVTGTNGKTTTTFMLAAIFEAFPDPVGLIGTVEIRVGSQRRKAVHTTPEATDLQRLLATMVDSGVRFAAMEVSSHGLALRRADATRYRVAIFTNLTQDHLDFHRDLERYFHAKARLFSLSLADVAVVNIDDPYGRRLVDTCGMPVVTVSRQVSADWRAGRVESRLDGTRFELLGPHGPRTVNLSLAGDFNVTNALQALAAADVLGIDPDAAITALEELTLVPGRFERVDAGQPFTVVIDYAHTPDSLDNSLRAARRLTTGRVIIVFGCGGDRDRGKRPVMGEIAGRLADTVVLTSDNPRSERPEDILDQVIEGVRGVPGADWKAELDRRSAIRVGLEQAGPGDLVLVAGKGHEQGQEITEGRKIPFDDRVVVLEELDSLLRSAVGR